MGTATMDGRVWLDYDGADPVIHLRGRFSFRDGPELRAALTSLVMASTHVVVDLADVEYLDPSALAALLSAGKQAIRSNGSVTLRSPNDHISRMLATSGAARLVTIAS